ncbi:transposase, partial [Streptomyces hirsutus]
IVKSWVDTGFKKAVVEHGARLGIDVEVVDRNPGVRGFHVVKRRWVVERSIGWIMMHRRLARDYETLAASSEAMIHVASIDNLAKRITDEATPTWRGTY